jgi:hypothetical protein
MSGMWVMTSRSSGSSGSYLLPWDRLIAFICLVSITGDFAISSRLDESSVQVRSGRTEDTFYVDRATSRFKYRTSNALNRIDQELFDEVRVHVSDAVENSGPTVNSA